MNKSYSKLRHIQEANQILEKRMLSEKKQYLIEGPQYIRFTFQIPTEKNDATGKFEVKVGKFMMFTAYNEKGTKATSLSVGGVNSITTITLPNGTQTKVARQQKDAAGNITGSIAVTDQTFADYLQTLIGKSFPIENTSMPITYVGPEGPVTGNASPVNFVSYDIYQKQTPTKP